MNWTYWPSSDACSTETNQEIFFIEGCCDQTRTRFDLNLRTSYLQFNSLAHYFTSSIIQYPRYVSKTELFGDLRLMCTHFSFSAYLIGISIQIFMGQKPIWTAITKYELGHTIKIWTFAPECPSHHLPSPLTFFFFYFELFYKLNFFPLTNRKCLGWAWLIPKRYL